MKERIKKIKDSKAVKIIQKILSSKYFPFATAAVTLLCYYLGWDVVLFYYIAIVGIAMLLLLDDITPVISLLLFMSVSISLINTPSRYMGTSDYYHNPAIYIQIFIIIGFFVATAIYRLLNVAVKKNFKLTPMFFGLCGFCVALFINGLFSENYTPKNLLYGFIMSACFLGIYSVLKDNVKISPKSYENIAYAFFAFSVLLIIELIVRYAVASDKIFRNGVIYDGELIFGWGVNNTLGVYLVMCIPPVLYLAGKKKLGFLFTIYSLFLLAAVLFSYSKQSMVGAAIIYIVCFIILLVKGKNRIANICIAGGALLGAGAFIGIFHEFVFKLLSRIFEGIFVNGELSGTGRIKIWREAIENFKAYPLFGKGFYVDLSYEGKAGLSFIPLMAHNTILQLLSSCGVLGLATYMVHRVLTVISFFKNKNTDRAYISLIVLAMLIICLFDNHIFNIFPTIIYASLIAVLDAGEMKIPKEQETGNEEIKEQADEAEGQQTVQITQETE